MKRQATLAVAVLAVLAATFVLAAPTSADSSFGSGLGPGIALSRAESTVEGGDLYVIDGNGVGEFQPDGTLLRTFGSEGSGPGQFRDPVGIAVDNSCAQQEPPLTPSSSPETCEEFDPSYGDVYVTDQENFRVEKFSPTGQFLLMIGGEVNKTAVAESATRSAEEDVCPAPGHPGDTCGAGVPGAGPAHFYESTVHSEDKAGAEWSLQSWRGTIGRNETPSSLAVGPDGALYVGDFRRVQEFSSEGAYEGQIAMPEAEARSQFVDSLAVDAESHVYADSRPEGERQQVKLPASGTYELCFDPDEAGPEPDECTEPIPYDAEEDVAHHPVAGKLEALAAIGHGNVVVETGSSHQYLRVSFSGALAHRNLPQMTATNATVETLIEGASGELVELAGPKAAQPAEVLERIEEAGEPTHLALDQKGDLFVSYFEAGRITAACTEGREACPPEPFRAYKPGGELYALLSSSQALMRGPSLSVQGIVIGDAAGQLYAAVGHVAAIALPQPGPPIVEPESEQATEIEPTTATLKATVNPEGFAAAGRFQYIEETHYLAQKAQAEGEGKTPQEVAEAAFEGAEETSPQALGALIQDRAVSAGATGLHPETAYRYRAALASHCNESEPAELCEALGEAAKFSTLPPVSVRGLTTQTVAPELVTLKFELDPNNGSGTQYTLEYGEGEGYGKSVTGSLASNGGEFALESATLSGLRPDSTYHYRLTAHNSYPGQTRTADATFTTEETLAEQDAREACPNALLREENNSLALPDCRAYERVSPADKGGFAVGGSFLAPSGDRAAALAIGGVLPGGLNDKLVNYYSMQRTAAGWRAQPALALGALPPDRQPIELIAFDAGLERWLVKVQPGPNLGVAEQSGRAALYIGEAGGSLRQATPMIEEGPLNAEGNFFAQPEAGASADFSRLVLPASEQLLPGDERPSTTSPTRDRLYTISGAGGPDPQLSLLAELPLDMTGARCGVDQEVGLGANIVSADGSTVFYDAPLDQSPTARCNGGTEDSYPNHVALYAWHEGAAAQLSARSPTQCTAGHPCYGASPQDARFYGSSPDGSLAWFTTEAPLVDSDADAAAGESSNDLYLARLSASAGLESLTQASAGSGAAGDPHPGEGAGVQGVLGVSASGEVAYFVASGLLTAQPNSAGESAAPGADNLYAYDAESEQTSFVGRLCSGPEESGSLADSGCGKNLDTARENDRALWALHANPSNGGASAQRQAHITPDGRYLLFQTYARLTPDDTDSALDVYRYDLATGEVERLSFGRRGNDGGGNDSRFDAELPATGHQLQYGSEAAEDSSRSISADGALAVFLTAAPLVSADTDEGAHPGCVGSPGETGCDVYEWSEDGHGSCREAGGCVSLVSDGVNPIGASSPILSSSGRDISFVTSRNLVPGDEDGLRDIYDAREGGGFPYVPPEEPCGGAEVCHGKGTSESLQPKYTSEEFAGPGNSPGELHCARGRHKVKKHGQIRCVPHHRKPHRKHHRHRKAHHRRANANRGGTR